MLELKYDSVKTLDAVVYLLSKSLSKEISMIHLVKMLYFADRESLKEYNFSITGDSFASLPYGPIVSKTYDIMKGSPMMKEPFGTFLEKKDRVICLKEEKKVSKLSEAEEEILDEIYNKFIHYTPAQLIDYCHDPRYVPEWKDPGNSSIPIDVEDLLVELGKTVEEIRLIKETIREEIQIQSFLNKYEA